jgi:hypothetical protein
VTDAGGLLDHIQQAKEDLWNVLNYTKETRPREYQAIQSHVVLNTTFIDEELRRL